MVKKNPWRFHPASTDTVAKRIADSLKLEGKDVRIRKAAKKAGFTVWERD